LIGNTTGIYVDLAPHGLKLQVVCYGKPSVIGQDPSIVNPIRFVIPLPFYIQQDEHSPLQGKGFFPDLDFAFAPYRGPLMVISFFSTLRIFTWSFVSQKNHGVFRSVIMWLFFHPDS